MQTAVRAPLAPARGAPSTHTHAAVARDLLRFALPTVVIMLLAGTSLVVDTYFVARLGSAALAGVTLVFPLHLLMVAAFGGGIGVGLSVVLSVRVGRGDWEGARRAVGSALVLALGASVALLLTSPLWIRFLFAHMSSDPRVVDAAVDFARPLLLGAPCIALSLTLSNILRAEKRPREGAVMLLVSAAVNTALNPVLVYGKLGAPAFGVAGASIATVAGFLVSAFVGVLYLRRGRFPLDTRLGVHRGDAVEIARIALPTLATYVTTQAASMTLTVVWGRFGTDALASFGLAGRLEYLLVLVVYGMGSALLTLGGEARGAGDRARFTRLCKVAASLVVACTTALALFLVVCPESWFGVFRAPPAVVAQGTGYLRFAALSYPFYALGLTLNYAYQTLERAHVPLLFSLVRGFVIAVPFAMLGAARGSVSLAAGAVALSLVAHGVAAAALLPRVLRRSL